MKCSRTLVVAGLLVSLAAGAIGEPALSPADGDPAAQDIRLAFGAFSAGLPSEEKGLFSWADVIVNGKGYPMKHMVDIAPSIRPGECNRVGIRVINYAGPAGLMGRVKLMVRDRAE